jgi:hypothetical protein
VPYDAFLDNLVSTLSPYDTFGIMFAGCHELFELIPATSRFAAQRLKEEQTHPESIKRMPIVTLFTPEPELALVTGGKISRSLPTPTKSLSS